ADWCGPCRSMVPVVQQLEASGYPIRRVNIDRDKELAAQFHIHSIPCFVLVVDGREVDRSLGATDPGQLKAMFNKAGFNPAVAARDHGALAPQEFDDRRSNNLAGRNDATVPFPGMRSPSPNSADQKPHLTHGVVAASHEENSTFAESASAAAAPTQFPKSLYASVRVKIEDSAGNSYGTGTIVDAGDGEALILTCGHVFRDSDGKGRITVDIFGPKPLSNIPGKVVHFDLKNDVGLISIRTKEPVPVAKIAPAGYQVHKGDPVFTVGCNHGGDPTVRESRINSLDKFLGPANLQVAGQPVQGRSGGGLFTKDGLVIGVCNAADPSADEGLFAALSTVQGELDHAGLSFVYRGDAASAGNLVSAPPPEMPKRMPSAPLAVPNENTTTPVSDRGVGQAICIIRPSDDPKAKSEVIVLNQVSPTFLHQLEIERQAQAGRTGEQRR
ncbi:MAG TPA: trypsin-like peptidase domain-containing protein, partial [Pirellulales bacterium]|nr:trypsin-like peptidase domain-containing protein [Pirellulales bacterium]